MQEKEEEGRKRGGGGGKCLIFFKGIINSLSALVCIVFDLFFKYI